MNQMDAEQASNSIETVKKALDWELIEREYKAGQLSVRAIAKACGCADASIRERAAKEGWKRNLDPRISQETKNKLAARLAPRTARAASAREGARLNSSGLAVVRPDGPTDSEIVDSASEYRAQLVTEHMQAAAATREGVKRLVEQLMIEAGDLDQVREGLALVIDEQVRSGELSTKESFYKKQALRGALALPALTKSAQALASALKSLTEIERKAIGLDDDEGRNKTDPLTYEERMRRLHEVGLVDTDGTGKTLEPLDDDAQATGTDG